MKSNEELYKDVMDKLANEPGLNSKNIVVGVKEGVVTLSGSVDSYADKWAVERAIKNIKGVVAIVNNLVVKLLDPYKRTDVEIAQAAINALKWNVFVPPDSIKAIVENGNVTLTGEVKWNFQREEAEKAVGKLVGVKNVTNLITLTKVILSSDVKQRIQQEFERNAEIDAKNIEVEVSGNTVTLKGKVHPWEEVNQAKRAAWSVPGVLSVINELTVEPSY